jgi:hypothetical protein
MDASGDMSPLPHCNASAAMGLAGLPLVCVDFKNTQLGDNSIAGWNFSVNASCPWTIMNGSLELQDYPDAGRSMVEDCGFTLNTITSNAYQGYGNLTLAVKQLVDIPGPPSSVAAPGAVNYQTANISLAGTNIWSTTGTFPTIVSALQTPTAGLSSYKPTFNLHAATYAAGTMAGWQIQSIVVMASN